MLFGKIKRIILSHNKRYIRNNSIISPRHTRRYGWINVVLFTVNKSERLIAMSRSLKFRHFLRDLSVTRLWSVWTRSNTLSSVVKRCRKDRGMREMLQSVKQTIFRSKRTLLLSVTAAYKNNEEEADDAEFPCQKNITDEELESLTSELESVDELSRLTLYCTSCGRRLAIDKRYADVRYCSCKAAIAETDSHDGWVPYMEADDVIIWRKEYKSGQRFAYKVYGRYPEVMASDFAAVQVDGRYRRAWDDAVAALSTVEDNANGVQDQMVLHWEVMWPRMFSNRDYVYIRRHKQYNAEQKHLEHKDNLFKQTNIKAKAQTVAERPSVHSHAKRKAMETEVIQNCENKVFVIISKSCVHDEVPETKNAVRVKDYWSKMVVKSLHGTDRPGMEFVLTYYDDAGGGGLPGGVTAWATGRAAPAYLARMRRAAIDYTSSPHLESEKEPSPPEETTKDQSTQTDIDTNNDKKLDSVPQPPETCLSLPDVDIDCHFDVAVKVTAVKEETIEESVVVEVIKVEAREERQEIKNNDEEEVHPSEDSHNQTSSKQEDDDCVLEDEENDTWWRYLYPFYYFL